MYLVLFDSYKADILLYLPQLPPTPSVNRNRHSQPKTEGCKGYPYVIKSFQRNKFDGTL